MTFTDDTEFVPCYKGGRCEDAPCCGCGPATSIYDDEDPDDFYDRDDMDDYDDGMDGDHDSALISAGWGTDEDYGLYEDSHLDGMYED